ncbi:MAG: hypothetical protein V1711_03055 [bacterium]
MEKGKSINSKIEELAGMVAQGFTDTQKEVREILAVMNERMDGTDVRLGDLQRGQTKLANQVAEIQDDLASALSASDNDGSAILNHEFRISYLEKLGGIKSVPAKHLVRLE